MVDEGEEGGGGEEEEKEENTDYEGDGEGDEEGEDVCSLFALRHHGSLHFEER